MCGGVPVVGGLVVRGEGVVVGGGGPPQQRQHVHESIGPIRLQSRSAKKRHRTQKDRRYPTIFCKIDTLSFEGDVKNERTMSFARQGVLDPPHRWQFCEFVSGDEKIRCCCEEPDLSVQLAGKKTEKNT